MGSIKRASWARALKWLIPVAVVAVSSAFWYAVENKAKAEYVAAPIPVRTMKATRGDLTRVLKLNGHVESESLVTVLPLVAGTLQDLLVDVGAPVAKNQVIAHIDAERFRLQLQQAEAAYLAAKSTYERVAQLYRSSATTQQSYEQAKGQYDAYASQYDLARLQLEYTNVKSPVDGVVLVKHMSAGSLAAPERPLVTIGDIRDLVVRAKVPERHYEAFVSGAKPGIRVSRPEGPTYEGRVKSVSPFVSADTKNFEVVVAIQGGDDRLRPGMFVALQFELARWPDALYLPFEALGTSDKVWWVEDGVARSAAYKPTQSSDESFAVPPEWADRDFIVEGHYFAREGSPVVVLGEGSP